MTTKYTSVSMTLSAAITAMPGPASLPMANSVSAQLSLVTTAVSYHTANPSRTTVCIEKMAKYSLRHCSGTLQMETRRSGSGVDISWLVVNLPPL